MLETQNVKTENSSMIIAKQIPLDNKINEMKLPFLCYDIAFKAVFTNEETILTKMVADITGMDYRILENNITLETNELPISYINEKAKRCDFILRIDKNNILNLELNSSHYTGMLIKNLAYLCQIFSRETKSGNKYNKNLNVMQINLNCYAKNNDTKSKNIEILNKYQIQNIKSHEVYAKNISILTLDIVKCYEKYYNLSSKEDIPNYIRWGALIYNRNFEEIPNIVKGIVTNKERDKIMDKIANLSGNNLFMSELESREWAEWERNSIEADAIERGLTKGMEQGIEQGIQQGIELANIQNIKNMYAKNISIKDIADITGKTVEEVKKIVKE